MAAGAGQLSLALRQAASSEGETTERVTLADLTGEMPADVAASARPKLEAGWRRSRPERKRAADELNGIRSDIQTLGAQFDDKLSKLSQPKARHRKLRKLLRKSLNMSNPSHRQWHQSVSFVGEAPGLRRAAIAVRRRLDRVRALRSARAVRVEVRGLAGAFRI